MLDAISNTSPLVYLHRIDSLNWLTEIFSSVWIPQQVIDELNEGHNRGYNWTNLSFQNISSVHKIRLKP